VPNTRDNVFDRVVVDHIVAGDTRVVWRLRDDFVDAQPHTFRLQTGESGVAAADDWLNVGSPVVDSFLAFDPTQRDYAITQTSHYRVKLTTAVGEYFSQPAACWSHLHRHDWLNARAVVRRELLRHRVASSEPGWLFKRRQKTAKIVDPHIIDPLTGEVIKTSNTVGIGTGCIGGYFSPVSFWMDLQPTARYSRRDESRGQVDDINTLGRAVAFPQLDHGDVWASSTGDARYAIHEIRAEALVRNTPIIVSASLRRLSPSDPIYELPLPPRPALQTVDRWEV
jgi:hypothetical protein